MNELLSHIAYLTQCHDCVTLPGMGAFVAHREPARFCAESRRFFPPRRVITFTSAIAHDDGLLAASVARRRAINYERAAIEVNSMLSQMRHAMEVAGAVHIPCVGVLQVSVPDHRLEFMPREADRMPLMLPELQLPAAVAAEPAVIEVEGVAAAAAPARIITWRRRAMRMAASVVALVGLGMALSTPISSHTAQQATLALASSFTAPAPAPVEQVEPIAAPAGLTLSMALPPAGSVLERTEAPAAAPVAAPTGRYVMVVASLPSRRQADSFIAADPCGASLSVLEKDGKFRVYITSGSTQAEAAERAASMISGFEKRYPGAWVCRR